MTEQEQADMYRMVCAIYHHLGIDGAAPLLSIRQKAEKDVKEWRAKQLKKADEQKISS